MDREDRPGPRRDRLLDQRLVEVQGVGPDVDEDRPGPEPDEGVGRRDERERRQDHLVARPEVAEHRGHLQGRRARRGHQHLADPEPLLQQPGATPGELAVAGDLAVRIACGDVIQLLAQDERLVERDRGIRLSAHDRCA